MLRVFWRINAVEEMQLILIESSSLRDWCVDVQMSL